MDKDTREELEAESRFTVENREKKDLIHLDGTAITEGGKLTKTDYLRFLEHDLDDYSEVALKPDEARKIHYHLAKLSTGATAMVPLYCGGKTKCPFANRCPLAKIDKAPIAKQCIIEKQLIKEYVVRYFNEFNVDPNSWTEVCYINELAEIDIYLMRLSTLLSRPDNAELIIEQVTAVAQDGTPILQKQISPYMDQKERLVNRKSKIIKLMVGDRQEKYKKEAALKQKEDTDPSSKMAQMRAQLERLQRSMDNFDKPVETTNSLSPEDIINAAEDDG